MYLIFIPLGALFAISPVAALIAFVGAMAIFAIDRWDSSGEY